MTVATDSSATARSLDKYRVLLSETARFHEKHDAGRTEPFNVFTVLRSESDEVNLHSRFLAALLDYRSPQQGERINLKEFLESVAKVKDFDLGGVSVEREQYNIDVLIWNANSKQAVVIENKIWAGDQPQQLQRYHDELKHRGYPSERIHLRYLTPFGHDPSEDSRGDLPYENIAYKDEDFQNWLRSCQQQAYNEPPLRESVGQYLRVVQKLTGTDMREAQLKELIDLCVKDENLVLAYDLKRAFDATYVQLILRLLSEIEEELQNTGLPSAGKWPEVSAREIRHLIQGKRGATWCGLYFPLYENAKEDAQVGVELNTGAQTIFWGVRCHRERNKERYENFQRKLGKGDGSALWWPWIKYPTGDHRIKLRTPSRTHIRWLANEEERRGFAKSIANEIQALWARVTK